MDIQTTYLFSDINNFFCDLKDIVCFKRENKFLILRLSYDYIILKYENLELIKTEINELSYVIEEYNSYLLEKNIMDFGKNIDGFTK